MSKRKASGCASAKNAEVPVSKKASKGKAKDDSVWNELSMEKIKSVMSAEGPVVKAVLLKADGKIKEVTIDCTPSKKESHALVGCGSNETISLMGQYCDLPQLIGKDQSIVLIIKRQDQATAAPFNKHKLQPPFEDAASEVRGDILLLKHDENTVPCNFTTQEWKELLKQDSVLFDQPGGDDEEDEDEEDGGEEDDDDDEDDLGSDEEDDDDIDEDELEEDLAKNPAMAKAVLAKVVKAYKKENGRAPTAQEMKTLSILCGAEAQ